MKKIDLAHRFSAFARWISCLSGSWQASLAAFTTIVTWIIGGFYIGFTDTQYQLLINSGTTIVTFLMVFLIQSTQNRDTQAIQLKLDELIRVTKNARENLINLEDEPEERLREVKEEFACEDGGTKKPGPGESGVGGD